jgi:hypothetical protein
MTRTAEEILRLKPADVRQLNTNDVRAFVYEWFAQFEHIAEPEYFLSHLDDGDLEIRFPEQTLSSHDDFRRWYEDVIRHIPWDFHDVRNLEVEGDEGGGFRVSFDVGWYGEKVEADEIDTKYAESWSGTGSLIAQEFRQVWDVRVRDRALLITSYRVTPAES